MATKKSESKVVLERTYTIPLRKAFINAPPYKKANRAVKAVQEFLMKHMKAEEVRLGQHVNEHIWKDGIKSPPPRVSVHAMKDQEGIVRAELEGKTFKESVRAIPKEAEGSSLKDKLTSKLGGKAPEEEDEKPSERDEAKA
jgi:large subunit ribosomal protein L31e